MPHPNAVVSLVCNIYHAGDGTIIRLRCKSRGCLTYTAFTLARLYFDVLWTRASSAWPLPEAQSPGPVSWHVRLPPPAKEECRCPWGKWKHLVLARPAHISAGPHELAGDACTEENRRPQWWPTSFLPHRPCRPQPRNTDEYVLGSVNTLAKLTKNDLHWGEIQALSWCFSCLFGAPQNPLWSVLPTGDS